MPRIKYAFFMFFLLLSLRNAQSASQNLESIFNNREGEYTGTVNGIIFLKIGTTENTEDDSTILDFQCGKAKLKVIHEEEEIYDSHYEYFIGFTTSESSTVTYSTYAAANMLQVKFNNDTYEVSTIDGACIDKVEGILATYHIGERKEYLVLQFTKEILLSNAQPLLREYSEEHKSYKSYERDAFLKQNRKYARVLPESVLVFVIKENKS
jgi:hypothetical protein